MTKKKQPALLLPEIDGAKVQRMTDATTKLSSLLFPIPIPASYSKEERAEYAKAGAEFGRHAAMVLAAMPERRAEELTNHFVLAILTAQRGRHLASDAFERLNRELTNHYTRKARSVKDETSKKADNIIWVHASKVRLRNPGLSNWAIASKIAGKVNAALAANGLKPRKVQAIAKRIPKLK
jgi:hypothetical protein